MEAGKCEVVIWKTAERYLAEGSTEEDASGWPDQLLHLHPHHRSPCGYAGISKSQHPAQRGLWPGLLGLLLLEAGADPGAAHQSLGLLGPGTSYHMVSCAIPFQATTACGKPPCESTAKARTRSFTHLHTHTYTYTQALRGQTGDFPQRFSPLAKSTCPLSSGLLLPASLGEVKIPKGQL